MLGAIAGDVIGSVYEFENTKDFDFPLFRPESTYTDDTVLTVAVADCLLNKAVWLGGDVDTTACMAGGIAQAFYKGVPAHIAGEVRRRLHPDLLAVADAFDAKFGV